MFIDKLLNLSNLCISLLLNPIVKSNSSLFISSKYCLYFKTLLAFLLQGCRLANIDHKKQYLSTFSLFIKAEGLKRNLTKLEPFSSTLFKFDIFIELIL